MSKRAKAAARLALSLSIAVMGLFACKTVERSVYRPVEIPGAELIGVSQCATCHKEQAYPYPFSQHAVLEVGLASKGASGCEICHGPGSLHMEQTMDPELVVNPGRNPEVCTACHLDIGARMQLPHGHAIAVGKVACIDCHDPHEGEGTGYLGMGIREEDQACYGCHKAQSGPYVYEHEAMREGCTYCHEPHGGLNEKMLRVRSGNLCLQCHLSMQSTETLRVGDTFHGSLGFAQMGACWSAGCHEAVHGSNVDANLRY